MHEIKSLRKKTFFNLLKSIMNLSATQFSSCVICYATKIPPTTQPKKRNRVDRTDDSKLLINNSSIRENQLVLDSIRESCWSNELNSLSLLHIFLGALWMPPHTLKPLLLLFLYIPYFFPFYRTTVSYSCST